MNRSLRLLMIEDSEDDAYLLVHELKGRFDVSSERVFTEAGLRSALDRGWDLAIVDYSIPGFSGLEALRIIRGARQDLPAIVVSGIYGEDFAIEAMRAGAEDYIKKGNLSRLVPAAERVLRESNARLAHRKAEEEIRLLNRLLKTISEVNKMIVRESDRDRILTEVCRIMVEEGGFSMSWIGEADFKTGVLRPVACSRPALDFITDLKIGSLEHPPVLVPAARSVSTGEYCISDDIAPGERLKAAYPEGSLKACASIPLKVRGRVVGNINVYAESKGAFEDKMRLLLDELADDIGYALEAVDEREERKKAVDALRESEERLRTIFESTMDGMFVIDEEGNYLDVNFAGCHMFGFSRHELLGASMSVLYFDEEAAAQYLDHKNFWATGAFLPEVRLRKKDGSEIWVDMTISPFMVNGKPLSLCVKRDITARRLAEEAFRESEERFHQIFEQNADGQLILGMGAGVITDANPAAISLFGYTRQELMEKGPALFIAGREFARFQKAVLGVGEGSTFNLDRLECVRKDGTNIIISLRGQMVRLERSGVVYCTIRDMTSIIKMEEEARYIQAKLIHTNKMTSIGTLASGVAHEINNPNNFILFNSSLLSEAWEDAGKVLDGYYREHGDFSVGGLPFSEMREVIPELLSGITEGSRRIKGIIDSLKDFSRMDRGGLDDEFDVNRAVMSAVSILSSQVNKFTDRFAVDLCDKLAPAKGSLQKIEQVVINLVMNALHSLPDRSRGVYVKTLQAENGDIEIIVKDEGCGIPPDVLERITEPFFTTKADAGGMGLGLSISYSIIKEHKGALEFSSEPGKGTQARIILPAKAF